MAERAMTLLIDVDRTGSVPLNRQIYEHVRGLVLSGTLRAGDVLPSSRRLATDLGVSRTVVTDAYQLLFADGYVEGRHGSGTRISTGVRPLTQTGIGTTARQPSFARSMPVQQRDGRPIRYDFRPGAPSWDLFPTATWQRAIVHHLETATEADMGYGPAEGVASLRRCIADHLRLSRALPCDPDQVVITTGATQALDLLARTVITPGAVVIVEEPTHPVLRRILADRGARLVPVPVDDAGLRVHQIDCCLAEYGAAAGEVVLIYTTPSHQFPTGSVLSLPRRIQLINWARRHDALIVEDDYDGEFVLSGAKTAALSGMAPDVCAYISTFSKTLFPSLRIGFAVLPPRALSTFLDYKWTSDRLSATLEQHALAELMRSGQYARHISRMRVEYGTRRAALAQALSVRFGSRLRLQGAPTGLHLVAHLESDRSSEQIAARAARMGARIYPADELYLQKTLTQPAFLLGYASMSADDLRAGIDIVASACE